MQCPVDQVRDDVCVGYHCHINNLHWVHCLYCIEVLGGQLKQFAETWSWKVIGGGWAGQIYWIIRQLRPPEHRVPIHITCSIKFQSRLEISKVLDHLSPKYCFHVFMFLICGFFLAVETLSWSELIHGKRIQTGCDQWGPWQFLLHWIQKFE